MAADFGIPREDVVVDPLVMPVGALPTSGSQVLHLIRRLRNELGVNTTCGASNVSFGLPNREAIKYFAAADVYMMPSAEEGFPRTLLEAMAAGCPFTAMDVGGVRDIVTPAQAEFVVPADDCRGMASALCRLLADGALRERLSAEGRASVQNYAQDKVVHDFVSVVST